MNRVFIQGVGQDIAGLGDLLLDPKEVERRFDGLFVRLHERTNRLFSYLLLGQWAAMVLLALFVSPLAWEGRSHHLHPHVLEAVILGGLITLYPAWLGLSGQHGRLLPHLMAVAQMLTSSLLIHLTGGRIETHFHIFGSLAILAFYRQIPVLLTASVVVYADHLLRGLFWPESVYGVFVASPWRSLEHGFWVLFEVAFLSLSIRGSRADILFEARRQVALENSHGELEKIVDERTAALSASEERFRSLFDDAPIGLYHADPDGNLLLANPALLHILGYASREEMLAARVNLREAGGGEDRTAFFAELLGKGTIRGRDTRWRRRDGVLVSVRESVHACRDGEGRLHFEGSVEDVTERKRLEESYFQSQKVQAIGQLAGGVAHDFNNILTTILAYADLIAAAPKDDDVPAHAAEIHRASERAAELTRQLLAFSRKQTLQPRVFNLNDSVADMDKMLRRLVGENIEIRTRLAPDLGQAKADPGQLQQVILNLAVNARDAMPSGGRLTIETGNARLDESYLGPNSETAPGEFVMIAVSDTGCGMPPEVKARLFEPFFTTKEEGKGTGLGLATCHGIVKQSGGHISVYSEPGIGTTFRVYLPRTLDEADASASAVPAPVRAGAEMLLLVEDEPAVRKIAVRALISLGYRIVEAADGAEALDLVEAMKEPPALVITDVVMPRMGGGVLAERLRERIPDLPILFTSGYTHDALERLDLTAPGTAFIPKPYSMRDLAGKVGEVLGQSKERVA